MSAMAQSQNLISRIGWERADSGTIAILVTIFAVGFGLLSFFYVNVTRKTAKENNEISFTIFNAACSNAGLVDYEKAALSKLLPYMQDFTRPHLIFESLAVFEHSMDAYVNKQIAAGVNSEQAKLDDDALLSVRKKLGYNVIFVEQPLISTRNISIGQKVSVLAPGQKVALAQESTVVGVSEFHFTVRIGGQNKDSFSYNDGSQLVIAFSRQGDAVYSVSSKIKGSDIEAGEIKFFHTLDFSRNQNRRHVRLDINLPVKFRLLERANKEKPPLRQFTARISEMSGGGLSFFAEEPLEALDIILIVLVLPDSKMLNGIKGQILRVVPVEGKTSIQYRHHVQFVSIEPQQREQIVKFVFAKHREILQMR
jgi:c-di-GMP-binding flagellar brake protein YcgR